MVFQIGDKAIHLTHGLGEIVDIETKTVHNHYVSCYVFQTPFLSVWIPVKTKDRNSLRAPKSKSEFEDICSDLESPNDPLPGNILIRKKQLLEILKDGQLISICRVIRDLSDYSKEITLSDIDKSILDRAIKSLLVEWVFSLSVPLPQAQKEMAAMLSS
ncbi:MAG: hypothetical protein ISR58_20565 [Anaerolineales bacterium]|nr:hypothetical protein [Chloroflexota bacterium]MBL6983582.1 hypothetical protein [Anaerolineales bacterium]